MYCLLCTAVWKKWYVTLAPKPAHQGSELCEGEHYSQMFWLFICVCSAWWQHVSSVSQIAQQETHSSGQGHRLGWWLPKIALWCDSHILSSLCMWMHCSVFICVDECLCVFACACVCVCLCVHVCMCDMCACVRTILAFMCIQSGIWWVSLHPWWASLSQMDGLSQCQRGDSWLAWPLLAQGLVPVLWQLLTAPDGWHVSCSPHPWACIMETLVCWEINDVSQCALMKCKLYQAHPGEMTPELISVLQEVDTLLMIE